MHHMNTTHFHDFSKKLLGFYSPLPRIFSGLEITIYKCHDFSMFPMTVPVIVRCDGGT